MLPLKDPRVGILKAMAHPVRLGLVETLASRRLRVGELAGLFPVDRTTISKHIAILREAGILETVREGREIYYRLAMPCLSDLLGCLGRMAR
ncbi:MAG TPA: metalloregulator ArsR/SmtB family transcription factor [Synergistales bacterium]|jgi:ArsR family transcriptional regulator|nr:MAG: Transcriptional regulator, ArsR family [Synergistales bacterium 57_84]KUK86137.1 MAG: Transcriptional regulator, ArsR family [Synergistales bacterium 58_81]HPA58779.1 metalloregulator ArsR/SmtB family transcription factor [Synergistales bacterium]HQO82447.1 metalloregulator ArsR/SmtB family transcription factor [Synergistales bacterium]